MEKNDFNYEANKFNNYINSIIFLSAKEFYRKEMKKEKKELKLIDDDNFNEYLEKYIKYNDKFEENQYSRDVIEFIDYCENYELHTALKSLSAIEQSVIFLLFSEELSQIEASNILNICSKSVSRIKTRAVKKLKNKLKGSD